MARGRGDSATMEICGNNKLRCTACTSTELDWEEQPIKDHGSTVVADTRSKVKKDALEIVKKLKPGDFIAVQARAEWSQTEDVHYRPGHFWLARIGDDVTYEVIKAARKIIGGTLFTCGDIKLEIGRYFDRSASDPSGLTFEEWTSPDSEVSIINACELRHSKFSMSPVDQRTIVVPVRQSGRRAAVTNLAPRRGDQPKEYKMDQSIDDEIRKKCDSGV